MSPGCYGILKALILQLVLFQIAWGLHLKGTFRTDEFFKFVTRFGFQKTDQHNAPITTGYIYGNFSLIKTPGMNGTVPVDSLITLAVMDYNYFIDYYNKRRIIPRSAACSLMFESINKIAYFFECNEDGKEDFIRRVPCVDNKYCIDEDNKDNVIDNSQFTFRMQDLNQARFWYISLSSCNRNLKSCKWNDVGVLYNKTNPPYTIAYDIWLVNGNPSNKQQNRFEHQYTYELHDIFEIYLTSLIFLLMVMPFIIYQLKKNFHYLSLQLLVYTILEIVCRLLALIHNLFFSYNGEGIILFDKFAYFLEAFDNCILVLIFISIAKGWTIRSKRLKTNQNFYIMGIGLLVVAVTSHMISLNQIDPVFNTNPYETTAGYVELSVRFLWMVWFLIELKETFNNLETAASNDQDTPHSQFVDTHDMQFNEIDSEPDDGDDTGDLTQRNNKKTYAPLLDEESRSDATKLERLRSMQIFYLHYGACVMVWFIYMPCLVFVTSFVTELYRLRLLLGIHYLVNFLTVIVLIYIIWSPSTPLKLPGKKPSIKSDIVSRYIFDTDFNEEQGVNDETVLFTRRD